MSETSSNQTKEPPSNQQKLEETPTFNTTDESKAEATFTLPSADRLQQRLHHIQQLLKRALKKANSRCILKKSKALKQE
jgi:hypothetical protein